MSCSRARRRTAGVRRPSYSVGSGRAAARGCGGRGHRRRPLIGTGRPVRFGCRRGGRGGRGGGAVGGRGPLAVDLRDLGVVGDRLAFLDQDGRERPGEGRGHLRIDLVGDDLDDRLVLLDVLPDLLEPLADGPLRHALAELGHRHLRHGSFSSRRSLRALPGCGTTILVSRIRTSGAAKWCVDAHPERVIALGLTAHGRSGTTGLAFEHAPACRWHARIDAARRLAHRRGRDGHGRWPRRSAMAAGPCSSATGRSPPPAGPPRPRFKFSVIYQDAQNRAIPHVAGRDQRSRHRLDMVAPGGQPSTLERAA